MKTVGLDPGRNGFKTFTSYRKWWYPAKLGTYRELYLEKQMTDMDMIVEFDGRKYFVGNIADESFDGATNYLKSKATFDTQLLSLVGIHKVVDDEEHIRVVICHPVMNNKSQDKVKLKEMLSGKKTIIVNNVEKTFYVDQVSVTPECACAVFVIDNIPLIAHGLDIGSATVNYATWIRGAWADKFSGTIPYGFENSNLPIDAFARKIAMDFSRQMQSLNGNIYVMGGLADRITPYLIQCINTQKVIAVPDALYANAKSCYEIGVKLDEREKSLSQE